MALKRGNVLGDDLDDGDGAKYANECPECRHQVTRVDWFGLAIAQEMGDGIRHVIPWRRGDNGVEEAINVKVPRVMRSRSRHGDGAAG